MMHGGPSSIDIFDPKPRLERDNARHEPDEIDSALTYVGNLEKQLGKPDAHLIAWQSHCQVLIATNEFRYLN